MATSGTFSVKLPKHYFGLGITFTGKGNFISVASIGKMSKVERNAIVWHIVLRRFPAFNP